MARCPRVDTVALTRDKVEPSVRGLSPGVEQDAVLTALEKSVVFLTSALTSQRGRAASRGAERGNHLLRLAPPLRRGRSVRRLHRPRGGAHQTRTKEWLLNIEYRKRETFGYSYEAYARGRAREEPARAAGAGHGLWQHGAHLRGARRSPPGRRHCRRGGCRSERLERHPRTLRAAPLVDPGPTVARAVVSSGRAVDAGGIRQSPT